MIAQHFFQRPILLKQKVNPYNGIPMSSLINRSAVGTSVYSYVIAIKLHQLKVAHN